MSNAIESEWHAVREACGLLDTRFRGLLSMRGEDRVSFLQGMVSNDVARLKTGQGTYAALLNLQGKVISDLRIYALADTFWLDAPVCRVDAVREALERYIVADDAELEIGDVAPLISMEGPQALRALMQISGESIDRTELYSHWDLAIAGSKVHVALATHTGENGFLIFGHPDQRDDLLERCRGAGAVRISAEALDVLRIEAGIPWHGRDMDETTLIGEVGLEDAISFNKGCYLGQEVVERVSARGQVQRKLVGLLCEGQAIPAAGTKLMHEAAEVGWITSAAWSPACAAVIALGYVRRGHWTEGTVLQVLLPDGSGSARVRALPFYRPQP